MDRKILVIYIIVTLMYLSSQTEGCKLYCLECTFIFSKPTYYCCMEDWQDVPLVKKCGESSTSETTPIVTPTTTSCPTIQPRPSRCPKSEITTNRECESYKRFYPNPKRCSSDEDCIWPFNACCEDACFNFQRICKTFREEFKY